MPLISLRWDRYEGRCDRSAHGAGEVDVEAAVRSPAPADLASGSSTVGGGGAGEKDEAEPSSVCLDGMVRSFMEDGVGGEKAGHGGRYCNCFHGGDNSDDEEDDEAAASDVAETIKVVAT